MENPTSTHVLLEDTDRRERAKARLYVLFQVFGWGAFLAMQIVYSFFLSIGDAGKRDPWLVYSIAVLIVTVGILLTHGARPWIEKWNWKHLDWRPLVLRVLALAAVLGAVWIVGTFGYLYGILRLPWLHTSYPLPVALVVSWINCACMMVCWLGLYFFYHLFDRLNRSEIERLRLATTVKESELRALKSQVNPHFIFNSLNSLRALIDEDPARARQSVTQLSNLLRYSLQSSHLEAVPFENELQIVNDYLALEQVRHAIHERAGFSCAGPRDHEERPVGVRRRPGLRLVESRNHLSAATRVDRARAALVHAGVVAHRHNIARLSPGPCDGLREVEVLPA